jgi:hypothetical protein
MLGSDINQKPLVITRYSGSFHKNKIRNNKNKENKFENSQFFLYSVQERRALIGGYFAPIGDYSSTVEK